MVEIRASTDLPEVILSLQGKTKRLNAMLPQIAEAVVAAVSDVYDAEGPDWEPLAPSTQQARRGDSYKILQDTGIMAGSTSPGWGTGFSESYAEAYAGVSYAQFHATGTRHMPKRNPFELGPFEQDVLADVAELVAQEITT